MTETKPAFDLTITDNKLKYSFDVNVVRYDKISIDEKCALCERGIYEVHKRSSPKKMTDAQLENDYYKSYHMNLCTDCRNALLNRRSKEIFVLFDKIKNYEKSGIL